MIIHKRKKSLIDIVNGSYISQMTEEEFENFCDIPTTELSYSLGYFYENLLLPHRSITMIDKTFIKIYNEFQRIMNDIRNSSMSDSWKSSMYSNLIAKICLADHYRKEIDKEYQKQVLNIKTIKSLNDEINDFYSVIQIIYPSIVINNLEQEDEKETKKRIRIFNNKKNSQ